MGRKVVAPAIYRHFKHLEDGKLNNYLYVTIGVSKAVEYSDLVKMVKRLSEANAFSRVKNTETDHEMLVFEYDGQLYHNKYNCENDLVIYKSLYDNKEPWARPVDVFLSEVDHEKYPNVKQKYRFELNK